MGAGFYRHEGETGGFCKVGRDEKGSSFNRVEHAAACIVFEDAISHDTPGVRGHLFCLRTLNATAHTVKVITVH